VNVLRVLCSRAPGSRASSCVVRNGVRTLLYSSLEGHHYILGTMDLRAKFHCESRRDAAHSVNVFRMVIAGLPSIDEANNEVLDVFEFDVVAVHAKDSRDRVHGTRCRSVQSYVLFLQLCSYMPCASTNQEFIEVEDTSA
jgi:hypothetical protein